MYVCTSPYLCAEQAGCILPHPAPCADSRPAVRRHKFWFYSGRAPVSPRAAHHPAPPQLSPLRRLGARRAGRRRRRPSGRVAPGRQHRAVGRDRRIGFEVPRAGRLRSARCPATPPGVTGRCRTHRCRRTEGVSVVGRPGRRRFQRSGLPSRCLPSAAERPSVRWIPQPGAPCSVP